MIYAILELQISYRPLVVYKGKWNIIFFCTVSGRFVQMWHFILHSWYRLCLQTTHFVVLFHWSGSVRRLAVITRLKHFALLSVSSLWTQPVLVVQSDTTFLSIELHYSMALLLINAYTTHVRSKQIQRIFTDGHSPASVPGVIWLLCDFVLFYRPCAVFCFSVRAGFTNTGQIAGLLNSSYF